MLIPLVVALWENRNFGGVKRTLIEDVPTLWDWNFDKKTSAIGVHPGPSFNLWTSFGPTVTFLGENPNDGSLTLGPGAWADLSLFNWNDRITAVRFNLNNLVPTGAFNQRTGQHITVPSAPAATIARIPLVLDAWTDSDNLVAPAGSPLGKWIQLVESSPSLSADFGAEFNDSIKGIRVRAGPDYNGYDVVRLCRDDYYQAGYSEYGPVPPFNRFGLADWGSYGPYTSSVLFTQPQIMPMQAPVGFSSFSQLVAPTVPKTSFG